jgi:hypothetical protein
MTKVLSIEDIGSIRREAYELRRSLAAKYNVPDIVIKYLTK